jgi:hypothetical protein
MRLYLKKSFVKDLAIQAKGHILYLIAILKKKLVITHWNARIHGEMDGMVAIYQLTAKNTHCLMVMVKMVRNKHMNLKEYNKQYLHAVVMPMLLKIQVLKMITCGLMMLFTTMMNSKTSCIGLPHNSIIVIIAIRVTIILA